MEIIRRITVDDQSRSAIRAAIASSLPAAVCLLLALAVGVALPIVISLPKTLAVLACLAICGLFALVVVSVINLPLTPILRLSLLASFWFQMEVNFFPIFKNHAEPPGFNVSLMLILSALLAAAWLGKRWQGKEREKVLPLPVSLTLVGLWLWCSLTVAYGEEGMLGIYALWTISASMLMCFVVAAQFSGRRALQQLLIGLAVMIAFNAILGIAQHLFPSEANSPIGVQPDETLVVVKGEEVSRVRALLGSPNSFAWTLGVFLPLIIAPLLLQVTSLRRWQRLLLVVAVGLGMIALILTYSRGSWIAFTVSVLLMTVMAGFILKAKERKRLIFRFAGVVIMTGLLAIPFSDEIVSRLADDDRGAAEVRLPLIQVALAMIADNPAFGVGPSSYGSVMRNYDETPGLVTEHFDWPVHNVYLLIAAETGLPGLLLFLALVIIASGRGWMVLRNSSADPTLRALALGLLVGMAAYLITGLKEASSFQTGMMRPFFLLCGLLLANERASRRAAE